MNRKQLIVMWVGIVIFILIGIRPPWAVIEGGGCKLYWKHRLLFSCPNAHEIRKLPKDLTSYSPEGVQVFTQALCVEWAIIVVTTVGLIVTFNGKRTKGE